MKIRAVTLGMDLPVPEVAIEPFEVAGRFLAEARQAFEAAGIEVQTTRLCGPALESNAPGASAGLRHWATSCEAAARQAGIEYISLGRVSARRPDVVAEQVAPILAAGEIAFLSADLIDGHLPSVAMAQACARAVKQLAFTTRLGFGNLRFAATAHCPPNIPFLPAAFHGGGPPC
ncbi:MAG TPA: DUF711 family protein, partial [Chloroflexota bacterium]